MTERELLGWLVAAAILMAVQLFVVMFELSRIRREIEKLKARATCPWLAKW